MVSSVGRFVAEFEQATALATGAPDAVATSSGTTALQVALTELDVRGGDLVIQPSFTFIASANAVAAVGAEPWLMDVDDHWLLDFDQVEAELTAATRQEGGRRIHIETGRRVAALLPVYTIGNIPDLDRVRDVGERFGLPVLADAAAALGADWKGRPFGPATDLAAISFNGNKIVTSGGGGMVVGPSVEALRRIRHLTSTARISADYSHDRRAFNYRMTNIQAAVGVAQMERLPGFVARKRTIRARYAEAFADLPGQSPFPISPGGSAWLSGMVLDPGLWPRMETLVAGLDGLGIEARPFWKPVHLQKPYADALCATLPRTSTLWNRILTLPCSSSLTNEDQSRVIDAVRSLAPQR